MKRLLIAAALALLTPSLLLPATAGAEVTFVIQSKGLTANAAFSSADPGDPCIVTEVFVFATEEQTRGSISSAIAVVAVFRSNVCTGTPLQSLVGSTTAPDLQGGRPLTSATLVATIAVEDLVSRVSSEIFVDLVWTGIGDLSRENGHFHVQRPGFNARGHFNGTSRQADVFGIISDGVTDFTGGEPAEDVLGLMEPELNWANVGLMEVTIG